MSNEEKIIKMLDNLQNDVNGLRADISVIKNSGRIERASTPMSQKEAVLCMSKLLSAEEKARFGAFMDAEEARKAAL